jgi:hypothetical protein
MALATALGRRNGIVMKHINVPAQVTTVEDRIAGNLTLTQLSLLAAPIFLDFGLYTVIPKAMHMNLYKVFMMLIITLVFCILAIRLKNKIILYWAITIMNFKLRSRVYVFNKNSLYLRDSIETKQDQSDQLTTKSTAAVALKPTLNKNDTEASLPDLASLNFIKERKGRLYVYVNQRN